MKLIHIIKSNKNKYFPFSFGVYNYVYRYWVNDLLTHLLRLHAEEGKGHKIIILTYFVKWIRCPQATCMVTAQYKCTELLSFILLKLPLKCHCMLSSVGVIFREQRTQARTLAPSSTHVSLIYLCPYCLKSDHFSLSFLIYI